MARGLSALWLKGVRRIVATQRREARRTVKTMLAAPKPSRKPRTPSVAPGRWPFVLSKPAPIPSPLVPVAKKRARSAQAGAETARRTSAAPAQARSMRLAPMVPLRRPAARGSFTRGVFKPPDPQRGALHYWLYWPASTAASARPLVVMLHGCGQTATEFAQGTRMNELAEKKGFAVLYPQQSISSESSRCWPWYTAENQAGGGDAATLRELLQSVLAQHRVDRRRIYVAGISAGAAMAQILALQQPQLFAAVGLHSAPVFGTAQSSAHAFSVMQNGDATRFAHAVGRIAARPVELPALLVHGDGDKVVRSVNLMQVARQFLLLNGIDPAAARPLLREHPARARGAQPRHGYRTLSYLKDEKPRVVVCQVSGLEHAWSGGTAGLRYNSGTGPDATALLWNFFSRQRRRTSTIA